MNSNATYNEKELYYRVARLAEKIDTNDGLIGDLLLRLEKAETNVELLIRLLVKKP